ncbi:hypothetical protein ACIRRA_40760 [Nocardia sp. NPDC101769]|uniref:hypothetical protein n=1 Tax=Nocardia sp. NPDC101769 TaxID=3364333 RepID=UPI0038216117
MISKTRAVRTGFAALVLAAGLLAVAGPATAEIPLTPMSPATSETPRAPATAEPILDLGSSNPFLPVGTTGSGPGSSNCQLGIVAGCYVPGGPH